MQSGRKDGCSKREAGAGECICSTLWDKGRVWDEDGIYMCVCVWQGVGVGVSAVNLDVTDRKTVAGPLP